MQDVRARQAIKRFTPPHNFRSSRPRILNLALMKITSRSVVIFCLSALPLASLAQTTGTTPTTAPGSTPTTSATDAANLSAIMAVLQAHADMVSAIVAGTEPASAAVTRLKTITLPAWAQGDADGDYADAAIDVGERLIVAGRQVEAALFFQKAEASLALVLARTPDTSAFSKAQILATRAMIRARFLGEAAEAKSDLDAAQTLLPNDSYLQRMRTQLSLGISTAPSAAPAN